MYLLALGRLSMKAIYSRARRWSNGGEGTPQSAYPKTLYAQKGAGLPAGGGFEPCIAHQRHNLSANRERVLSADPPAVSSMQHRILTFVVMIPLERTIYLL
jgi:hypothetical protein